jgi:hypothetical protein
VISAGRRLRRLTLAVCLAFGTGIAAETAVAVEPPSGSRNFTPPGNVPNYFSNETAPFRGTSGGQTASPGAGPVVAVPGAAEHGVASGRAARQHSVQVGRHRARLARGKPGRHGHQVAHGRASRGGKAVVARRGTSVRSKAIASVRRTAPAKAHGGRSQGRSQRVARARG